MKDIHTYFLLYSDHLLRLWTASQRAALRTNDMRRVRHKTKFVNLSTNSSFYITQTYALSNALNSSFENIASGPAFETHPSSNGVSLFSDAKDSSKEPYKTESFISAPRGRVTFVERSRGGSAKPVDLPNASWKEWVWEVSSVGLPSVCLEIDYSCTFPPSSPYLHAAIVKLTLLKGRPSLYGGISKLQFEWWTLIIVCHGTGSNQRQSF